MPERLGGTTTGQGMSFGERLRIAFQGHPSWAEGPSQPQADLGSELRRIAHEDAERLQTEFATDPDGMPEYVVDTVIQDEEAART